MSDASSEALSPYRQFIPDETYPRFSKKFLAGANTYEWLQDRLAADPFVGNWTAQWREKLNQPFKGITTDGTKREDLFKLFEPSTKPSATTHSMVAAAENMLTQLSSDQLAAIQHDIDAKEWRAWANPELYVFRHGLRLEETSNEFVEAVHELLKASLSPSGYAKVAGCMKVNHFLGSIVEAPGVLNAKSYNISIFGKPSTAAPWGWQLTGHHLCLNCFVLASQQVISPVFMGAEPNVVDDGPDKGLCLFEAQEAAGMEVMAALEPSIQAKVQIYDSLKAEAMPEWRFHRADQRHLGGAFQDNRVIPYEGVLVSEFPSDVQQTVRKIVRLTLEFLPEDSLRQKIVEIEKYWSETYFCWIGGWGVEDVFYYKIHSPVTMLEFDHHSGVFLTNKEPRPFHIHTLIRTPNGNDYGKELLRQYQEKHKDL
ncbi:uncharacterized protein PAC_16465 [Phialocephala subalpina]|uniref:DUF3500 domain-containing protein n=1 Tax=Phialocephala subalpina TaxID=576137 RepID=A0A1L7XNH5_9HELO|nr:uncharacterized protein PAC_16465 [Phialocephala subalpina]